MTANGGVRRPLRKLSIGDLHIRSHDEDPAAACREIRAILREIRESLKSDGGADYCSPLSNHSTAAAAAAAATSKIVQDGVQTQSPRTDVERPQRRDPQRSAWRHCRLSLPARLRPGHADGLVDGDVSGVGPGRLGRRRVPANVRFADELGMNLNTFAMIPSRQVRDDSPTCVPLPRVHPASVDHARPRSPPPPRRPHDVLVDGYSDDTDNQEVVDEQKSVDDHQKLETNHQEKFRLCFRQPFAELEQFRGRLERQLVCLENVRVDDWTAGAHHHSTASNSLSVSVGGHAQPSSMAANSVILCSIQTKSTSGRHHVGEKKVFARCTSDNWRTFADLPAQRVTGLDSLGLGYDRYCFAVRRPVAPEPLSTSPCGHRAAAASSEEPSAAVEFAVCYETADCAFWDNNDQVNYRIEWFHNDT